MTLQLLIETSTEQALAAIVQDDRLIASAQLPFGYSSSKFLLPEIEKALKQTHLKIKDFSLIAVGVGPGSYTGIRVGVATAKGLAFACHKPLVGICSLETFIPPHDGPFAVLVDAKIGGAFITTGVQSGGSIHYTSKPTVVELDKIGEILLPIPQLVTPNAEILRAKLDSLYPTAQWQWTESAPDPLRMAAIAKENVAQGLFTVEGELEILYLRKTQAEIERERREERP
jgi:tRNA threonylcarbamoyladenosine biosynthesis protein TsaB